MHIVGPYLTTTSTKKRKEKMTKAKQAELEQGWRERNQRLKAMGLPKETLEQYTEWVHGRGKKEKAKAEDRQAGKTSATAKNTGSAKKILSPDSNVQERQGTKDIPSLGAWVTGAVSSKPSPTYTGSKIIGIGTMHKSNLVPIFSDDEAKDISKMRR